MVLLNNQFFKVKTFDNDAQKQFNVNIIMKMKNKTGRLIRWILMNKAIQFLKNVIAIFVIFLLFCILFSSFPIYVLTYLHCTMGNLAHFCDKN